MHTAETALPLLKVRIFYLIKPPEFQGFRRWFVGSFATRAHGSNQALGKSNNHHRGHQKRLDAHIHEPGDRSGCIIGVKRAQYPVAGKGCLDGYIGGFRVTDLTHHNHVGVLAQDGSQPAGKSHAGLTIQLDLADLLYPILHRIFHRNNIDVRLINFL